jgi:predicted nucleic acid-binding protein
MTALVDTNIIIRHLTGDPPHRARAATHALATAEHLHVTEVILAECAHVLRSVYRSSPATIAAALRSLITQPNVTVDDLGRALHTLDLLERTRLGFADAHLAATAHTHDADVLSFDHGLDRLPGITRLEP